MQRIRFVVVSLVSVAAFGALAACSDQFPIGPPGARHPLASNPRSSAAIVAPNTRICSDPTTTTVQYNGNWVAAFLTDLDAVHANFPNAYATTIDGSVWISPTPTSGNRRQGHVQLQDNVRPSRGGSFSNAAIIDGLFTPTTPSPFASTATSSFNTPPVSTWPI
jgi:hypothetical protein